MDHRSSQCTLVTNVFCFPFSGDTKHLKIQGGVGRDVSFTCSSNDCTWEYSVHSGGSYSNPSNKAGVSVLGGYLEINNVVADHEGIYRCVYNGGQDLFNLTVVGK